MKILYIVSTLKRAGPVNQLYNLIKYLDHNLFEAYIITLSQEPFESRLHDFKELGVTFQTINIGRFALLCSVKKLLTNKITAIQPNIIHTQGIRADMFSNLLNFYPKICTIRNFPQFDYKMRYGKILSKIMLKFHLHAIRKLNCCVAVSDAVKSNLEVLNVKNNVITITNGVDTDCFHPISQVDKNRLRIKYALPITAKIMISTGHLNALKNPFMLISAFKNLFKNKDDYKLILVGDGPLMNECKKISNCNIHFFGRVKNVEQFLQLSDFYISASKTEGFPNAVLEALACGLPVLLSDIKPHNEIIDLAKNIGYTFNLKDSSDLENKIKQMLDNYLIMKKNINTFVFKQISARIMSAKYQKLYMNLTD